MDAMAAGSATAFSSLKPVFSNVAKHLALRTDTQTEYALVTRSPSPFPQHKGHPLDFGSLHVGKSYVRLHLMPLYMSPELSQSISGALRKRMQGKTCFNFKEDPDPELVAELKRLAENAFRQWSERDWI
jgi:hypothetical protein